MCICIFVIVHGKIDLKLQKKKKITRKITIQGFSIILIGTILYYSKRKNRRDLNFSPNSSSFNKFRISLQFVLTVTLIVTVKYMNVF